MNENNTEKVSVNINISTLSAVDLLVDGGYYSNRSDFINQAVRAAVQQHQSTIDRIVEKNSKHNDQGWFLGITGYTANDIDKLYQAGETMDVRGYGLLVIDKNCDLEKLFAVIRGIRVKGKVRCSQEVKTHYDLS